MSAPGAQPEGTTATPAADAPTGDQPAGDATAGDGAGAPVEGAGDGGQGEGGEQTPVAAAAEGGEGDGKAKEPAKEEPKTEDPAKPRPNLTARLAALSTEKRVAERKAREAEAARKAAEEKAAAAEAKARRIDDLIAKAKGDRKQIPVLLKEAGIEFEEIVNAFAEQSEEPRELTAEEKFAALEAKIEEDRAAREKEKQEREAERKREEQARIAREEENARLEYVASVAEMVKKNGEQFEICARLGDEAATEIFNKFLFVWDKAGRPQLMPGEFEEAILKAAEVQELTYEERGRKLLKQGKVNGTANGANGKPNGSNGAANGAAKDSKQPSTNGALSDRDAELAKALIDKTSAGLKSYRPKTINSSLGGSAPPKQPAQGSMDPKQALREALAEHGVR